LFVSAVETHVLAQKAGADADLRFRGSGHKQTSARFLYKLKSLYN
jgi:hypothetical protein